MTIVQNLMERLRPLVGMKGWDYCVLWKLSHDQRFIELIDCCCAGIDNTQNGEEIHFPVSPVLPCRDAIFQHPRAKSCELLAQLPSSIPLDSGIYAQTLISNQPRWLHFSNIRDLDVMEETVWTRVWIPMVGGLIELFVTKEVPEDPHVIDFIAAQCCISIERESMINTTSNNMDVCSSSVNNVHANNNFPSQELEDMNVPYDISIDRIRICNSPMNFLQQFGYNSTTRSKGKCPRNEHNVFFEGPQFRDSNVNQEMDALNNNNNNPASVNEQKDTMKPENNNGRSDSISDCSDQIEDEDDVVKYRRRTGKGSQAKNLFAERKRRKKLNDRLYALRALVPIITKLDRASIIVDAIAYVKQLQQQAKELQDELEENSDDDGGKRNNNHEGNNKNNVKSDRLSQNGISLGPKTEHDNDSSTNVFDHIGNGRLRKHDQDAENTNDKGQQMEPQVEVAQLEGNEFFVKVFCEHKPGGFVRLMEGLNSLGLEVTNANVTSFRGLVSNVFKVEKRDSEMVQADHIRDLLLEVTRKPSRAHPQNMEKASESTSNENVYHELQHHHHEHHIHSHHMNSHHSRVLHPHN